MIAEIAFVVHYTMGTLLEEWESSYYIPDGWFQ